MKITDKRAAKVWLSNSAGVSVSFFVIPLSAIIDGNGAPSLASDLTEKIVVPANSHVAIDIPAGYRVGIYENPDPSQTLEFFCNKIGVSTNMPLTSIGDSIEPGEVSYYMIADCVHQGDVITASVSEPA